MPPARPRPARVQLFRAAWLEAATLTPFPLFAAAWIAVLGLMLLALLPAHPSRGTLFALLACISLGAVAWFLFEYAAHRFLFHLEPRAPWARRLIYLLHENHHQDPSDPLRGLMPLPVTLPVLGALWLLARSFGSVAEAVLLGFAGGYALYDAVHWACHQRPMRGRLSSALKRHHLRHHHVAAGSNYAITAIFLDRLFGTTLRRR